MLSANGSRVSSWTMKPSSQTGHCQHTFRHAQGPYASELGSAGYAIGAIGSSARVPLQWHPDELGTTVPATVMHQLEGSFRVQTVLLFTLRPTSPRSCLYCRGVELFSVSNVCFFTIVDRSLRDQISTRLPTGYHGPIRSVSILRVVLKPRPVIWLLARLYQ